MCRYNQTAYWRYKPRGLHVDVLLLVPASSLQSGKEQKLQNTTVHNDIKIRKYSLEQLLM